MKKAVIVSGGNIQKDFALDFLRKIIEGQEDGQILLAAADRGLEFLEEAGILPDLAVGDFDSISRQGAAFLKKLKESGREICRLKPEKDDSDTQSALMKVMEKGAQEVYLLGATGSRLDHVLANLELLSLGESLGSRVVLADANNYVQLVKSGTVLQKDNQFGKYVSFFPVGGDVTGLTLEGFRYPLQKHHLRVQDSGLTVSNEIVADFGTVTFETGTLLMILSRD